jgi:hypothetical protein
LAEAHIKYGTTVVGTEAEPRPELIERVVLARRRTQDGHHGAHVVDGTQQRDEVSDACGIVVAKIAMHAAMFATLRFRSEAKAASPLSG